MLEGILICRYPNTTHIVADHKKRKKYLTQQLPIGLQTDSDCCDYSELVFLSY